MSASFTLPSNYPALTRNGPGGMTPGDIEIIRRTVARRLLPDGRLLPKWCRRKGECPGCNRVKCRYFNGGNP